MAPSTKNAAIAYSVEPTRDNASDEGPQPRHNPWWKFGGNDQSFIPSQQHKSEPSLASSQEDDELNYDNNIHGSVFSDSRAKEFYKPIEKYEGRHRFDMHATWSDDEEKKLVRKVR